MLKVTYLVAKFLVLRVIAQIEKFGEPIRFAYVAARTNDWMMMPPSTLIAIGGGGATHGTHPELDRLCLEHVAKRPRIGYIGTASGADPQKYKRFCAGFERCCEAITQLPFEANQEQARIWVEGLDLVYVGGGNPVVLVDHWNSSGIGGVLAEAFRRGVTLAGVSAGAMCWFEGFLWRSPDDGLQLAMGLGLIKGTMTPHSLIEPDRRAQMIGRVSNGSMPDGYAVDDGAALFKQGDAVEAFPPKGPPFVYRISRQDGETPLNA